MQKQLLDWLNNNNLSQFDWLIGYSGGLDSHVLLHLATQLKQSCSINVCAVHVNHGLQPQADQWADHCQRVCENYNIPIKIIPLNLTVPMGESLEEFARVQRYAAIVAQMSTKQILLTAHHLDDQAETLLIQLLRGAGPEGLAAMPACSFEPFPHARPFLNIHRQELSDYAKLHELRWIEDYSNFNTQWTRNDIRQNILPQLEKINPSVKQCLARSAKHCAVSNTVLTRYLENDLQRCITKNNTLNISTLKKYPKEQAALLVRLWLRKSHVRAPSSKKLNEIIHQMFYSRQDAKPCVHWGEHQVMRHRDEIFLMAKKPRQTPMFKEQSWCLTQPLKLNNEQWIARKVSGKGIAVSQINSPLSVRLRQGGERLIYRGKTRSLKKVLHELAIPVWQRQDLPILYYQGEIIAVGSHIISDKWQVNDEKESGLLIERVLGI